ncbi:MAG: type II toxin-antitoxin system RelE/ParE family toxin [Acidimicrobiaceae bacterium]|nr:type II toxin-antitoxin system RelE/ParE family toxin [Acidimicrobiaceae bacterium]
MTWEVEVTDQFVEWWHGLTVGQQHAVTDRLDLLAERGPDLGRPVVDRVHSSRHQSMKELRAAKGGALRVLFMPIRAARSSCSSAGTRAASGTTGTSGRCRWLTICTTST